MHGHVDSLPSSWPVSETVVYQVDNPCFTLISSLVVLPAVRTWTPVRTRAGLRLGLWLKGLGRGLGLKSDGLRLGLELKTSISELIFHPDTV